MAVAVLHGLSPRLRIKLVRAWPVHAAGVPFGESTRDSNGHDGSAFPVNQELEILIVGFTSRCIFRPASYPAQAK